MRFLAALIAGFLTIAVCGHTARAEDAAFQAWLQSLWPQAEPLGVSRTTFDNATRGLEPDLSLPDLVLPGRPERPSAGQPEFVQTPADYLKEPAIEQLAAFPRKASLGGVRGRTGIRPTSPTARVSAKVSFGA